MEREDPQEHVHRCFLENLESNSNADIKEGREDPQEYPYLYLGYWVPGSSKMDYKVDFNGVEIFQNNIWQPLSEVEKSPLELHPLNTAPVSEQVSSLSLPDSTIT